MRTHRSRIVAAVVAVLFVPLYGASLAAAVPSHTIAPKLGDTPADFGQPVAPAPKIGDTPADFGQPVAPAPKGGDTPADYPGASRAPVYDPPATIQVVRPERTIVREVDAALPIVLGSLALLVALGGTGLTLARTRRGMIGRAG
jgi:hypothetical protein